jgi:nitrite reductase (cytochrome c-552)
LITLVDFKTAQTASTSDGSLDTVRRRQRRSQFLLNFIEAENSMGLHAGQEARALSTKPGAGQVALSGDPAVPIAECVDITER